MKRLFKMALLPVMVGFCLTIFSMTAFSQHQKGNQTNAEKSAGSEKSRIRNQHNFKVTELEQKWSDYIKDAAFKALVNEVKRKGYKRIDKNEKTALGFSGKLETDTTNPASVQESVEICVFDFYRKTEGGAQMLSMVWRRVGSDTYVCYIEFPENEKNIQIALEKSTEFTADNKGNLIKAHSLGRCWANCVFTRFGATGCVAAIATCGAAAAGLVALGIGVTTPAALAIFGTCAGVFCLYPLAVCLAYCY